LDTKEQRILLRKRARARYAEDPEYRQRRLRTGRTYRSVHREEINARWRFRYANDPEYRERILARRRGPANRVAKLRANYGLSPQDYAALLTRQNGVCAICKRKPVGPLVSIIVM
jgi:hypothetical protein